MRHGSNLNPKNRFEGTHFEPELDQMEWDTEFQESLGSAPIEYIFDESKSIVAKNNSPDLPFNLSVNPYRGCIHGCAYCYARPSHEYLGMNAGLEFETKIVIKKEAPALFRAFLSRKNYKPEVIAFSGVTDCYQPAEREFQLSRQCLEVALRFRQPIGIVTKNALICRDIDLLQQLSAMRLLHVYLSITTLDPKLARDMEPRTSIPSARLRAIQTLAGAGIPVGVMTAPIIPGLNDSEIPAILREASQRGARTAGFVLLRLPLTVEPVFKEWLERTQPDKAEMVLGRIRKTREGALNNSDFGTRMRGSGVIAEQIKRLFSIHAQKYNLHRSLPDYDFSNFTVPSSEDRQGRLF